MADLNEKAEEAQEKTKNMVARHPLRAGVATMAAIFGTGYIAGHKHAESRSLYQKIMRQIQR